MDYEKKYKEALERAKEIIECSKNPGSKEVRMVLSFFPELRENEDERIRAALINIFKTHKDYEVFFGVSTEEILAWLEKKGEPKAIIIIPKFRVGDTIRLKNSCAQYQITEISDGCYRGKGWDLDINAADESEDYELVKQKPAMIQWNGDNLREVVELTGLYKEGFAKWFHGDWGEYECYVHSHNNIFKLFNEDGSHYEVPVGAWIVKTPDGYNIASKAVLKPVPAEWSEQDERKCNNIITLVEGKAIMRKDIKGLVSWLKSLKDRYTWKPSEEHYELEEFVKIVRGNLTGISKAVQKLFEAKYLQLTGNKMYGGFKD